MHVTLELSGHPKANVKRVVIADRVVVGRSRECGLQIASAAVSRKHCELRVGKDSVSVIDLGSSNGTFLDSTRLPAGEERPLPSGCRLNIGGVRFVVTYETADKTSAPIAATSAVAGEIVPGDALPVETLAPYEEVDEVGVSEEAGTGPAILNDASPQLGDAEFADDDPILEDVEPLESAEAHASSVAETKSQASSLIDDEPDLDEMFAESSDIVPSMEAEAVTLESAPSDDEPVDDEPILEEDEDQAFGFLTDDEPASKSSSKSSSKAAEDSRLGDFLSQLGRD